MRTRKARNRLTPRRQCTDSGPNPVRKCGPIASSAHGDRARALGPGDGQGGRELPGVRRARAGAGGALARPHQGRRGARERRARAARRRASPSASPRAGDEVANGEHDDQFPIDVFQTGSGTSSNMNANEVIANLAGDGVHPNDHVNMGQSSNDVFPSAVHLAAVDTVRAELLPALERLAGAFQAQGRRVGRRGQGRPHPHDGRGARDARAGVRRLRGADHARARPRARRARPRRADPARRHRHRHRPQHAPRVRRARAREARARRGAARPLRGAGQPRLAGGAARRAQGRGRVAHQDRQRPGADGLRARAPGSWSCSCPSSRRARRSCPARSTR